MTNHELSMQFFIQLAFILTTCHLVGRVARRFGQQQVVAEMVAGVLLGPSLFGLLFPAAQTGFFPKSSMGVLYVVSQVGLVLYMFLMGLEFDLNIMRRRIRAAAAISVAGMLAPFLLGGSLALYFIGDERLFSPQVSALEGVLYLGAAMSITAFPVLARLIHERGLSGTSIGTIALAAGSIDDAAAWCILALALASFTGAASIALFAIGGALFYATTMLLVGKPLLRRLGERVDREGGMSGPLFSTVMIMLVLGAWFTDVVGIHSVFGAFILGLSMPRGPLVTELRVRLEPLTVKFLLPLFFVYSGLNTKIGLVDSPAMWALALLILLVACFGKGVACWLAARISGESQHDAIAIGTLMNARGLMELIILNIGLERGIITPTLFTIMVIMAVVTTLMTSPIFELVINRRRAAPLDPAVVEPAL